MHPARSKSSHSVLEATRTKQLLTAILQDSPIDGSASLKKQPARRGHSKRVRGFRILLPMLLLALLAACGSSPDQRAHSGEGPTPTPRSVPSASVSSLPAPSEPGIKASTITDNSLNITTSGNVTYAGTVDQGIFALSNSNGSLLWHTGLEGAVTELPVVDNNVVYTSSYIGEIGPATLSALKAGDGSVLWKYHNNGYIPRPVIENGVVYLTAQQDGVIALRASDGEQLWHFKSPIDQGPQVVNGVLYVQSSAEGFYALRASDGKILWHNASVVTANPSFTVQDGVIFGFSENSAFALRASDGHQLWNRAIDATFSQLPQFSDGVLYLVATKISLEMPTPTPEPTATPSPTPATHGSYPSPRLVSLTTPLQKHVSGEITRRTTYLKQGKSTVYALSASDGKILWQDRLNQGNDSFASTLQIDSDRVYVAALDTVGGSSSSTISALSKQDGRVIWQRTAGGSTTGAVLTRDMLYLSVNYQGRSAVYALKALDGRLRWSYAVDGDTFNGLVLGHETLYIGSNNGIAYALRSDNGTLTWHYRTKGGENA